jgi:enoyl-CoA hydratase/carnithine racemase
MDRATAAELLRAAGTGAAELLGALDGEPCLVVDLDRGGGERLQVPETLPCVVIGTSGSAGAGAGPGPGVDLAGVDVALTSSPDAPRPWVHVDDLDVATALLTGRIADAPVAAVTLAQVLRLGGRRPVASDLVVESLAYSALLAGPEHARWLRARPPVKRAVPAPDQPVVVVRRADVLEITLNRPDRHNAFGAAVRDALYQALSLAATDPTVTAVALGGAGPSFCSGGDLDEFATTPDPATAHLIRTGRSCARVMADLSGRLSTALTVRLHGACIGAGIELAALAGRVIADADTRIRLPEVGMGLIPGAGGTAAIPRRVGRRRTAWLALTGATLDAVTALDWGLVDELVR